MISRVLAIGIIGLGVAGCEGDFLHQDRPGGSDYRPGRYSSGDYRGDRDDRRDEIDRRAYDEGRRGDDREFCLRYPEQCRDRRY
jgi:hypothetical protein